MELDTTVAILKYDLSRYQPMRIILRENSGVYEGYVEKRYYMSWDERNVQICWTGEKDTGLGKVQFNGIDWALGLLIGTHMIGGTIYDPLQENCPVVIDWEAWMGMDGPSRRNASYSVKEEKRDYSCQNMNDDDDDIDKTFLTLKYPAILYWHETVAGPGFYSAIYPDGHTETMVLWSWLCLDARRLGFRLVEIDPPVDST